jgi:hypothetical protein
MRSRKTLVMCVIVLFCSNQVPVRAAGKPMELHWGELAPIISGHNVELLVQGTVRIKGEVVSVREDALVIDVKKTANPDLYPKGSALIPRASVNVLKLQRSRGSWGRGLGTVVGVLCGVTIGGYVALAKTRSANTGIPTFLAISSGTTIAGYYFGRAGDSKTVEIKVVP